MLQDKKGFIWLGTRDGLNKFDGISFTNYQDFGNNYIRSIVEGDNNELYLGTDDGLVIMNMSDETFEKIEERLITDKRIIHSTTTLFMDSKGLLWIGTMSNGVYTYNPKSNELSYIRASMCDLMKTIIWEIYEDKAGSIWLATRFGLFIYNRATNTFNGVEGLYELTDSPDKEIYSIHEDQKGNLWLGTWDDGLYLYNRNQKTYTSYYGRTNNDLYIAHIKVFLQYDNSNIFVGAEDGMYLFNTESKECKRLDVPYNRNSLSDQNIYSFMQDREGGIWVGTYLGGLNYLNTSIINIENYFPDNKAGYLSGKAVSQFCEDEKGNLWIGTFDGGLNYFDVKTKEISRPLYTSYNNIYALMFDNDELWIGTYSGGIDVYNLKTKSIRHYKHNQNEPNSLIDDCVTALFKTSEGDIYVGTSKGLNKYNRKTSDFTHLEKDLIYFVFDIKEDASKNIWFATYSNSGMVKFNPTTNKWIYYNSILPKDNPAVNSKLTGIYIDAHNQIWFSSEGRGIFLYDAQQDNFINYTQKDGLPNNNVYGILDDQYGNIWISTNKGLACLNPSNLENIKSYGQEDGLQSNEFNYKASLKSKAGKLYFGGINGFNSFYPEDLTNNINNIIPSVEISNIELLGDGDKKNKYLKQSLYNKENIKLSYKNSSFTISFVSLSFIAPTKNQYAYKLEGIDSEWTYVGNNRSVTYVNPAPGKYTFKVKASNNQNIWNEQGTHVIIEILPPFWLSLPAKSFYALLFFLSIYLIIMYFIKRNKIKQNRKLDVYKAEQEALAFKSKIDFFTNIAHEIRTPVSLIKAPLEDIVIHGSFDDNTKQNLAIIEKNSERLTVLINQLLDFRKMDSKEYVINYEKINLKKHLSELYERFRKTAQSKKIDFELILPQEEIEIISDADAITKITGNFLTNALKYTTDKIILKLIVNLDNSFTISVEDNGKGINEELKSRVFDPFYQLQSSDNRKGTGIGLFLVKHLSEILGGTIELKNSSTGGSIFSFSFKSSDSEVVSQHNIPKDDSDNSSIVLLGQSNEKKHILVVEDNLEMLHFIGNSLKTEHIVHTTENASEALMKIEDTSYDLIITDIMMPDIDGLMFTKQIRENVNYSHIPIILLSAKTDNNTKIEGLRLGADVFIEKPFSTSYLKAQISSLLKNRKAILEAFNKSPFSSYSSLTTNKSDRDFIIKLNNEIDKNISDSDFTLESLSDKLFISRSNLQRKLKSVYAVTPGDYLRTYRLKKAASILLENGLRINEVAFEVGFNSASYFTKCFVKQFGIPPKDFVKDHSNTKN